MSKLIVEVLIILALPTIAFLGGSWLMSNISHRERVTQSLARAEPNDRKPLYQRLTYDVNAVKRYWGAMNDDALHSERRFLQLDLVFPFLYGSALAFSLFMAWDALGRRFSPAWVLTPVAITIFSDWAENLLQLRQLNNYLASGKTLIQPGWIRVASIATLLKLSFFGGTCVSLILLVILMFSRSER